MWFSILGLENVSISCKLEWGVGGGGGAIFGGCGGLFFGSESRALEDLLFEKKKLLLKIGILVLGYFRVLCFLSIGSRENIQ